MVASLYNLCLLRVCNLLIDGVLPNVLRTVPIYIRRLIFETLVARQKLSDPNCLKYMEDLLSDDSTCAIEAIPKQTWRRCRLENNTYNGFVQFLQNHFENFPNLADRIATLHLATTSAHTADKTISVGSKYYSKVPKDLAIILQIISRCRNLKHLSVVNGNNLYLSFRNWLEAVAEAIHCSGSSGLVTLEVFCCYTQPCYFEPTPDQKLAFRRLKYIHLHQVYLSGMSWSRLLECCNDTLESVVLYKGGFEFGDLIPITLDNLTSLDVDHVWRELNLPTLPARCPKLRSCYFDVNTVNMTADTVSEIKVLLASLVDCSISLLTRGAQSAFCNELFDAAADKITKLQLCIRNNWTEETVRQLILGSRNLRDLVVADYPTAERNKVLDQCLRDLFYNKERAGNLLKLKLHSPLSDETLDQLFINCTNLEVLELTGTTAQPTDEHFEIWIEHGARPYRLHLDSSQLSGRGLKLLIAASGSNLTSLRIDHCDPEDVDSIYHTLMRCCPMLDYVKIPGVSERILQEYDEFSRNLFYSRLSL